jgi:nucleotide-binding universal stress UspA family protein
MPAANHERQQMASNPPTAKQLAYLKALAERAGQTFAWPGTNLQASIEIRKLRGAQPASRIERRIERREIADAIATGGTDSSRVQEHEVAGWGSTATWSQRA